MEKCSWDRYHKWKKIEDANNKKKFCYLCTKKTGRKCSRRMVDYFQVIDVEWYFICFYIFWSFYINKKLYTLSEKRVSENIKGSWVKSVHGPWGVRPSTSMGRQPGRNGAHPAHCTCTVGWRGRDASAPGSWRSQMAVSSWGRWCCVGASRSPGRQARMGTVAGLARGAPMPSQRRLGAAGGRCGAGSEALSMLLHRPCAAGHTCH